MAYMEFTIAKVFYLWLILPNREDTKAKVFYQLLIAHILNLKMLKIVLFTVKVEKSSKINIIWLKDDIT